MATSAAKAFAAAILRTSGPESKIGSGRYLNSKVSFHVITVPKDEFYVGVAESGTFADAEIDIIYEEYIKLLAWQEGNTLDKLNKIPDLPKDLMGPPTSEGYVKEKLLEIRNKRRAEGHESFIGPSYNRLLKLKSSLLRPKVLPKLKEAGFNRTNEELKAIAGVGDRGIQYEHGGQSGLAAVGIRSALASQKYKDIVEADPNAFSAKEQELINSVIQDKETLKVINERTLHTNADGTLLLQHVVELSAGAASVNQSAKVQEEAVGKALQALGKDLETLEGSPSLAQALEMNLFFALTKALKGTGAKVTINGVIPKKDIQGKSRGTASKQVTYKTRMREVRETGANDVVRAAQKQKAAKGRSPSSTPLQLLGAINKNLPAAIKADMGEPKLVNRTGRFADSVKAVSVIQERGQGMPVINYQYQRDPYEVFEVGSGGKEWATTERDPRGLIEGAIRKAAAELAINRFMLRRI